MFAAMSFALPRKASHFEGSVTGGPDAFVASISIFFALAPASEAFRTASTGIRYEKLDAFDIKWSRYFDLSPDPLKLYIFLIVAASVISYGRDAAFS